jgi:hypothetical protein
MKFVEDEKLHVLANSISDDLLANCLDTLTLDNSWQYWHSGSGVHMMGDGVGKDIGKFYDWVKNRFSYLKGDATICVIHKIEGDSIYSTFVVINPSLLFQLEPELRRILNLKAFL